MSIASRIESINEHLEDAYDSLENIGIDLTGVNKNISNLSAQIESVYTDLPKTTDTDTNITLNNTKKGKMELNLKGNTYQFTTTGKNKFGITSNLPSTVNQVTFSKNNEGMLIINGTASQTFTKTFTIAHEVLNGDYEISFEVVNGSQSQDSFLTIQDDNNNNILDKKFVGGTPKTLSLNNITLNTFGLYIQSGTNFNNYTVKIQLEPGTLQTSYEPYTGGIASPNPNYPQNIKVVTGENNIIINNKNLFNKNNANIYNGYFTPSSPTMTSNSTHRTIYIECKPNTTYTIQKSNAGEDKSRFGIGTTTMIPTTDVSVNQVALNNTATSQTITTNSNAKYLVVWCYFTDNTAITESELLATIQIEYGSTATVYELYQSQSYPINLGNLELCKTENNQDYIYENNNHWYIHKEMGKIILNGEENWQPNGTGTYTSRYSVGENTLEALTLLKDQTNGYCNNNKWVTSGVSGDTQVVGKVGGTLYYRINTSIANTTANFKTYLASNNAICYTALKTNTENEITDTTLINQLNTLKLNCKSYNAQTNISQINNNAPFIITASALSQNNS